MSAISTRLQLLLHHHLLGAHEPAGRTSPVELPHLGDTSKIWLCHLVTQGPWLQCEAGATDLNLGENLLQSFCLIAVLRSSNPLRAAGWQPCGSVSQC